LAVSDLTAINVGTEKMCASTGDIDTEIDQLTFDFGNPTGRSLQSTPVLREGSALSLGTVGVCGTQDPCRAQFESVTRVDGTACFIEGTPQSSSGQIRLYTKQIFRPVETYRIRLGTGTTASNTIEASVVRLPGASNDHAAVAIVDGIGTRSGTTYSAGATISVYRPPQNPSAPRVLDILAAWYYPDRRLIGITRFSFNDATRRPITSVHDEQGTRAGPSWILAVRVRESLGNVELPYFTCNDDRPYSGEARCPTEQLLSPVGQVVTDVTQEFVVSNVR